MDNDGLDALLRHSLAARTLPSAERTALADWADRHASDADRAAARSRAFALAQSSVSSEAVRVVEWLAAVLPLFDGPAIPTPDCKKSFAYFSPGKTCIHEVIRQFDIAQESCDVCVFTITDDRITDAIIRANARGVAVRIITDDEKAHDLGSDIDKLQLCGIPCKMDSGNAAHMHHKFALFDGRRLMTGSFNWTRSASEQNEENLLVTPDPDLVAAFAGRFEYLWGRLAEAKFVQ